MPSIIERLARRVVNLEKKVNQALTSPQLGNSSLENGGKIEEYDENGQLVQIIGRQPDGTHGAVVVSGPTPPPATAPVVTGGSLPTVTWDGTFADPTTLLQDIAIPAPMDFTRVEIHASKESGFAANTAATLLDTIESPRGSTRPVILEPGRWYFCLVVRASSGKASRQSLQVSADITAVDVDKLRDEFNTEMDRLAQDLSDNGTELTEAQERLEQLTGRVAPIAESVEAIRNTELPALQSMVNTKNKTVNSTANAAGTTGYSPGDTWQKWTSLDSAGKLVAAWRFTVNNEWVPVVLDPTYLPQVDIGDGTFGQLSGGRLKVGSVETQHLLVGSGPNLIPNGAGEYGRAGAWSEGLTWNTNNRPNGLPGSFISNGGTHATPAVFWEAEPLTEYKFEVWVKANVPGSVMYIEMRDQDGNHAATWQGIGDEPTAGAGAYPVSSYAVPTGWTKLTARGLTNAAVNKMRVGSVYFNHTNGTVRDATQFIAGMRLFRMTDGSMVVENTIKAKHVDAESVGAAVGAFVEADIGKLRVTGATNLDTLVAERIAANIGSYLKLYASQVFIGEPGNLMPDPNFLDLEGWQLPANGYSVAAGGGRNGNNALDIAASSSQAGRYYAITDKRRQFRVTGGSTYKASVWVKAAAAVPVNGVAIYGKWTNPSTAAGGNFATPGNGSNKAPLAANVWTELPYEFTVPTEATHAFIGLYAQASATTRVLFSEPSVKEVITPSLIVEGFFQGQRVIGASIETNAAADVGFKLNDRGLTAHSVARAEYGDGNVRETKMRAVIDARVTPWSVGNTDKWPGLWLEGDPVSGTRPQHSAGVTVGDPSGGSAVVRSGRNTVASPYSEAFTAPGLASVSAYSAAPSGSGHRTQGYMGVTPGSFNMSTGDAGGNIVAQVYSGPDGVLELKALRGVKVNGQVLFVQDTGWVSAQLLTDFQHRTSYGWAGIKWRAYNGVFTLMGSTTRSRAWNTGEAIAIIPDAYLPPHRIMGTNAYADRATKTVQAENAGAANSGLNFTVSWPYV